MAFTKRKIDGRWYKYAGYDDTKSGAQTTADAYRHWGKRARVVLMPVNSRHHKDYYTIWVAG